MRLPPTLLLVRHAWAGERGSVADDAARPLDARGRAQAAALPAHLDARLVEWGRPALTAEAGEVRLVSSPMRRCIETLAPLGRVLGREVRSDDRLAERPVSLVSRDGWPDAAELGARAAAALAAEITTRPAPEVLVLCAHGEILPALVATLVGGGHLDVPASLDLTAKAMAKGGTWAVLSVPVEEGGTGPSPVLAPWPEPPVDAVGS